PPALEPGGSAARVGTTCSPSPVGRSFSRVLDLRTVGCGPSDGKDDGRAHLEPQGDVPAAGGGKAAVTPAGRRADAGTTPAAAARFRLSAERRSWLHAALRCLA